MSQAPEKKRTIFILYIPGGAMLGIIPATMLARLEELTETPASHLFQVIDGVSTGSIVASSMAIRSSEDSRQPKLLAQQSMSLFSQHGPSFFPDIPSRYYKMTTANLLNIFEDSTDPLKIDKDIIEEIGKTCGELEAKLTKEADKKKIKSLRELATKRWVTRSTKKSALKICESLFESAGATDHATHLAELIFLRSTTSRLGIVFRQTALSGANMVRKIWARDYMYDTKLPENTFKNLFGEARLSDCLRSTYISAYDLKNNSVQTFFCRKKDFFSLDPNEPCVTSENNNKLWDVTMASIANPFAFPPHVTEDGTVCSDKAPAHAPMACVMDVLAHKPEDADVKLVVMGTGSYLTREDPNLYVRYGFLGNLLKGREFAEVSRYNLSTVRNILRSHFGDGAVIEMDPRLSARKREEIKDMPARDVLDASPENVERIVNRAKSFVREEDAKFRDLAKMLVENLYNVGTMDEAKYKRVMARLAEKPPAAVPSKTPQTLLDNMAANMPTLRAIFTAMNQPEPAREQDKKPVAPVVRTETPKGP